MDKDYDYGPGHLAQRQHYVADPRLKTGGTTHSRPPVMYIRPFDRDVTLPIVLVLTRTSLTSGPLVLVYNRVGLKGIAPGVL